MVSRSGLARAFAAVAAGLLASLASAECECGYSTPVGNNDGNFLFTEAVESNFVHLNYIENNTDWRRQQFDVTPANARGPFGKSFRVSNVESNGAPVTSDNDLTVTGADGGPAGIQLIVRGKPDGDLIPTAELDTAREDMLYGTFRAAMRVSDVPGTCAAFFWYFNDTQEIDMEFLSKEFNRDNKTFPINLVLQSREAAAAGFNAAHTPTFVKVNLPFDPTADFHEYRIDFISGRVFFLADGKVLAEMSGPAVPTSGGHMIITHWSNGDPGWSAGPPARDAVLTVAYAKMYFNSTLPKYNDRWKERCKDPAAEKAVCRIPDSPSRGIDNESGRFFFGSHPGMTPGQEYYGKSAGQSVLPTRWPAVALATALSVVLAGVW